MAPKPQNKAALRTALLDQLAHLLREIEALQQVLPLVPEPLQTTHPLPEEPSLRETYGILVAADEQVFLPTLQALVVGQAKALALPDDQALQKAENWNARPLAETLQRLEQVRQQLILLLQEAPPEVWEQPVPCQEETWDLYQYVYFIIQHDTELLRALACHLYTAYLPGRPRSLV